MALLHPDPYWIEKPTYNLDGKPYSPVKATTRKGRKTKEHLTNASQKQSILVKNMSFPARTCVTLNYL
jgi:hypothetical protein